MSKQKRMRGYVDTTSLITLNKHGKSRGDTEPVKE
jgi:hypothetical protein